MYDYSENPMSALQGVDVLLSGLHHGMSLISATQTCDAQCCECDVLRSQLAELLDCQEQRERDWKTVVGRLRLQLARQSLKAAQLEAKLSRARQALTD